MDYEKLLQKRNFLRDHMAVLPSEVRENYERAFAVEYAHHSTAIEGNTLTLMETKLLIEDKISIGGKPLREIYEVTNHDAAFNYAKRCIADGKPLDEEIAKNIHEMLMENIQQGGIYRSVDVRIGGASHTPPTPNEMYSQIKFFYADLPQKTDLNAIELAAWTHAEFVRIHPHVDGNGRTSRLLMNYQLMAQGFLPVNISAEERFAYYDALEYYAVNGDLAPFAELVAELEHPALDYYINAIEQTMAQTQSRESSREAELTIE